MKPSAAKLCLICTYNALRGQPIRRLEVIDSVMAHVGILKTRGLDGGTLRVIASQAHLANVTADMRAEDTTAPHLPWRVSSSATLFAEKDKELDQADAGEQTPERPEHQEREVDAGIFHGDVGDDESCRNLHPDDCIVEKYASDATISSSATAMNVKESSSVDGKAFPCGETDDSLPSAVNVSSIIMACQIFDDGKESMGNHTAVTRERMNDVETARPELRSSCGGGGYESVGTVIRRIDDCDGVAKRDFASEVPPTATRVATVDGARYVRKKWRATPPPSGFRRNVGSVGQSHCRRTNANRWVDRDVLQYQFRTLCATAGSLELREASKVINKSKMAPIAPTRAGKPRPIWSLLRSRTLRVTQQDPSVFRRDTELGPHRRCGATQAAGLVSPEMNHWHVINRRIFGAHEVLKQRIRSSVPEWMLFAGGLPPPGLSDVDRWTLRLGHSREENAY